MMNFGKASGRFLAALVVLGSGQLRADVKMPAIFGDHMVLQQDAALPIWGTADAGEKVTVTAGSSTGDAVAGADGKWMVKLPPLPAGTAALTLTVAGKNTLTFQDVLVGDVWIASGQSNMQFPMSNAHNAATEIPKANDPQLRLFTVVDKTAIDPQTDLTGTWVVCTPDTVKSFSAVAYFFARDLRAHLNRPIGLIGTYWGGTPAQSWTSIEALKKEPALQHYVDIHDKIHAAYSPQVVADFEEKNKAYGIAHFNWVRDIGPAYGVQVTAWQDAVDKAKAAGQPIPPKPVPTEPMPQPPVPADGGQNSPCNLFNSMIAPLIPFAIKGAIWYQGESNAIAAIEYRTLFPTMITDWRTRWGQGDFPFLFVQLARYNEPSLGLSETRNSQLATLSLPNTGMATAFDIGDQKQIHPKDKMDVGDRLALVARHVAYGENLIYTGPIFDKAEVNGDKITVHFTQLGSGLVIGSAPWVPDGATPLPTDKLIGFTIAGADGKFIPADATIAGDTVIVSSPQMPQPVYVRYAFELAVGNLYNKDGLPAIPFRSDKGMDTAAKASPPPAPPAPAPTK